MIKSFYTIGKVLSQDADYAEYFEPWASPFPKIKDDGGVVVFAEVENGKLKEELTTEDFKKKLIDSYLYRKVQGANGTNLVPTLLLQVESNKDKYSESVRKLTKKVRQSILNNKHTFIDVKEVNEIENKLIALHSTLSFDKRYLFSFKIDGKYFGDFEEYKELFREEAYSKYYKDSSAKNKVCSVTYQPSDEVWGRVDTLGFTVDAVSFARNGFDVSDSYKMFPVSPEAVKILEGAKRIIIDSDLNLTRNFYGLKYFLLPRFISSSNEIKKEVIEYIIQQNQESSLESEQKRLINTENLLYEIIQSEEIIKSDIYFDIFFFQPNNAQFLIKLHLSDVLPSQFVKIFSKKELVEKRYKRLNREVISTKNKKTEDIILEYHITFGGIYKEKMPPVYGIKDYFSQKVRTDTIFHPFFYKVLEAVFYGNKLNKESVLKAFMEKIVHAFKNVKENPNDFERHVKTSFTIYQFFNELNLFKNITMENVKMTQDFDKVSLKLDDFVLQHSDYFSENEPAKKAAFYLGCLTTKMLSVQKKYYKFNKPYQEPFIKNLQNINFNVSDLKKLSVKLNSFAKYQSILHNYDFDEISNLESLVKKNLFDSTLSRTELSYAFTLGMTMQREFTKEAIAKSKENKETTQNN